MLDVAIIWLLALPCSVSVPGLAMERTAMDHLLATGALAARFARLSRTALVKSLGEARNQEGRGVQFERPRFHLRRGITPGSPP